MAYALLYLPRRNFLLLCGIGKSTQFPLLRKARTYASRCLQFLSYPQNIERPLARFALLDQSDQCVVHIARGAVRGLGNLLDAHRPLRSAKE